MAEFETLLYEEIDGVAWVTMNRPEVHNAFNFAMQAELKSVWRGMRHNDDVRCAVLTGAGEKAFCSGIDRAETMGHSMSCGSPIWRTFEPRNRCIVDSTPPARQYVDEDVGLEMYGDHVPWDGQIEQFV